MARKRAAYHHGRLAEAIVAAALELIADRGIHALSLRDVARRLGVSHQAPYRHFADKRALLDAIAADGFRELDASLRAVAARHPAPGERVVELGVAFVKFARAHPAHYRVMFADPTRPAGVGHAAFELIRDALRASQARGVFVGEPVRELALASFAFVHGIAMLAIDGRLGERRDRALIEHVVRGTIRNTRG
ncbi:MAG TPA: TetR/AcrR family transcriptional regulator [Kofleriaceae bacterium]|nr:TetR/AcrR family transcriptional regulator [Kofleriaceae bacterium]